MYVAEVAPSEIRGPALMMFQFSQSVSQLVGACINQGTESIDGAASYRIPMALLTVLPLSMLLLLPITPESPVWYMYKGKKDKARQALEKINRSNPLYTPENDLQAIEDQILMEREQAAQSSWKSLFSDPIERRKLLYACGAMVSKPADYQSCLTSCVVCPTDQRYPVLVHLRRSLRAEHWRRSTLHHKYGNLCPSDRHCWPLSHIRQ